MHCDSIIDSSNNKIIVEVSQDESSSNEYLNKKKNDTKVD